MYCAHNSQIWPQICDHQFHGFPPIIICSSSGLVLLCICVFFCARFGMFCAFLCALLWSRRPRNCAAIWAPVSSPLWSQAAALTEIDWSEPSRFSQGWRHMSLPCAQPVWKHVTTTKKTLMVFVFSSTLGQYCEFGACASMICSKLANCEFGACTHQGPYRCITTQGKGTWEPEDDEFGCEDCPPPILPSLPFV